MGLIIDAIALLVGNTVFLLYSWCLFFYASESLFEYLNFVSEQALKEKQAKRLKEEEETISYLQSISTVSVDEERSFE